MTFGEGDEDDCMAERGSRGPIPNIDCRGMNCMWGCTGWLLLIPDMLGCEGGADIICSLLLPVLLFTAEGLRPGTVTGLTPGAPIRAATKRVLSAKLLCLAFSIWSHSFIKTVSTSANCFNFSSNLFSCHNFYNMKMSQF